MAQLRKGHIITKTLTMCIVGLIEFVGIPIFLAWLSTFIAPFDCLSPLIWQWTERVVFCFVIYEIIVLIVRKLIIDAKKDMLLALKNAYELGELYCTTRDKNIYKSVCELIDAQLESGVFNDLNIRKDYEVLKLLIETKKVVVLQCNKIFIAHRLEACDLFWEYTLLLRFVK